MSKHILFLVKLEGERRPFRSGKGYTYLLNNLLHVGLMLTIIKVFIIIFLLLEIGNILAIFKTNYKLSFQLSVQVYSLLGQTEWERKAFFGRMQDAGWNTLWDYPQEHLVVIRDETVSPFAKFEILLSLLCFLLNPLTNKHCRIRRSIINLWIDSRTCKN